MSALPRLFAPEEEGPSTEELRIAVESGLICCECGTQFVRAHHKVTACTFCARRILEGQGLNLATHREANGEAWAERARQRRNSDAV